MNAELQISPQPKGSSAIPNMTIKPKPFGPQEPKTTALLRVAKAATPDKNSIAVPNLNVLKSKIR